MLLHVVEAARPVDLAGDACPRGERPVAEVNDDAVLLAHVKNVGASQRADVAGLAAALGIEGRFLQHDGVAALDLLAGDNGGGKALLEGIFIVKFSGLHVG